jgi:hypothetical protein
VLLSVIAGVVVIAIGRLLFSAPGTSPATKSINELPALPVTNVGKPLEPSRKPDIAPSSSSKHSRPQFDSPIRRYLTGSTIGGIIFVLPQDTDPRLEDQLTATFRGQSGLFSSAFFEDDLFGSVLAGDFQWIDKLELNRVELLFACRSSITSNQRDDIHPGMLRSEIRLSCRLLDIARRTSRQIDITGVGAGFSLDEAFRLAARRTAEALSAKAPPVSTLQTYR